jgi:hypothetical protein
MAQNAQTVEGHEEKDRREVHASETEDRQVFRTVENVDGIAENQHREEQKGEER